MNSQKSFQNITILPNKVFFSVLRSEPRSTPQMLYFSVENEPHFQYRGFFDDFGPPSLLQLYSFTKMIENFMTQSNMMLHFYVSPNQSAKSNAAVFISSFRMLHCKMNAEESFKPLRPISSTLKPFRDASTLPSTFDLSVLDCLRGLQHAIELGWFNIDTFDPETWARIEAIENGDMNWLIPNKLLAFASPYSTNILPGGFRVATPATVIPEFKNLGITHVIRLNKPFYDCEEFKQAGFKHTELYFLDGSTPPQHILEDFLKIAETDEIIALHCKAGLGRTGTLAGCYMIKNHGFTAREAIGWIRLCRAGSIIGPQQQYLLQYYNEMQRPQTDANQVHEPLVQLGSHSKRLIRNTGKGIKVNDNGENNRKGKWKRQDTARAPIRRPFRPAGDNLCVRATPINSFHPQPRKINQKEVNRGN